MNDRKRRGRRPILLQRTIDIMWSVGNTWKKGITTENFAKKLYPTMENARGEEINLDKAKDLTRNQIATARKRLQERLSSLPWWGKHGAFMPFYSGKPSPSILEMNPNSAPEFTERRYWWHTTLDSLEKLRKHFKKLETSYNNRHRKALEMEKREQAGIDQHKSIKAQKVKLYEK